MSLPGHLLSHIQLLKNPIFDRTTPLTTQRKGDFYTQALEDMTYLEIDGELVNNKRSEFKKTVDGCVKKKAFQYLIEKATNHSKVRESCYKAATSNTQKADLYTRTNWNVIQISHSFALFHTVKNNFRNNYVNTNLTCPLFANNIKTITYSNVSPRSYTKHPHTLTTTKRSSRNSAAGQLIREFILNHDEEIAVELLGKPNPAHNSISSVCN